MDVTSQKGHSEYRKMSFINMEKPFLTLYISVKNIASFFIVTDLSIFKRSKKSSLRSLYTSFNAVSWILFILSFNFAL